MSTSRSEAFDADVAAWLAACAELPTADDDSPAGVRAHARATNGLAAERWQARFGPRERPAASDEVLAGVPVRVHVPAAGPTRVVVHLHGGGWVLGDLDTHRLHAERWCVEGAAVVVSVDYRLAPEAPFPAAYDDSLAVTRAVAERWPDLPLVVGGDSAGAQVATSVALALRDLGVPLAAQLLVVPVTDVRGRYADPDCNAAYPSRRDNDGDFGLTLAGMALYAERYAPDDDADPRVSPITADLAGVAPAVVHTSGYDVLRDEGEAYAQLLAEAGVPVLHRRWPTLNHSYTGLGGVSDAAEHAARQVMRDLDELLAR